MRVLKVVGVILVLLVAPAVLVRMYLVHPTAEDILARMAATYGSAQWYYDVTTVESPVLSQPATYEIAYQRPDKLWVRFDGILENQTILCDGLSSYRYLPGLGQYTLEPAEEAVGPELADGQPMLTLALLTGQLDLAGRARYLGRAKADGTAVYVVRLERPAAEEGGPNLPELTFWVGAEDYLVRRLETRLPLGEEGLLHTLIHQQVSTQSIPATQFQFVPPDGARAVVEFEREPLAAPGDSPLLVPGLGSPGP